MNKKDSEKKVKLRRISRIDEEIRSGNYPNARELAQKLEVAERTVLRDLDELRLFYDAPIEYDYSKKGFYYSEPNFFIRNVILTEDEYKTINIYEEFLKHATSSDFDDKFKNIIGKIIAVIPKNENIDELFTVDTNASEFRFQPTLVLDGNIQYSLQEAIKNKEIIEIEYWTSSNRKYSLQIIKPLYIFYEKHHYYLLAFNNENTDKPGIYSINRIRKYRTTGKSFKIPSDFKLKNYIKNKNADVTPYDNKLYHFEFSVPKEFSDESIDKSYDPNQIIELKEDGTLYISFRSTELYEIFHWIIGQGQKVKVLNPPELVKMVKKEVKKVAEYYK